MPGNLTPLIRQYLDLKEKYSDCLLFFRLGDFYEMFFEDALTASKELEIVLTSRDCGLEERAPMCGVPYHSVDGYIQRLIGKGHKVAICEQLSDPALTKGLVERDVVRVITPGTVIEETILDERKNNYLLSLFFETACIGFAYADVSTGGFFMGELPGDEKIAKLQEELARIQPTEVIANDALFLQQQLVRNLSSNYYLQSYANWAFDEKGSKARLIRHFQVNGLDGFGCENMHAAISAAGALMAYLEETQKNALAHIHTIKVIRREAYMVLDVATRRNLELTKPLHFEGSKRNTLLSLLDRTQTAMGGRMLRAFIEQPLQSKKAIEDRLAAVEELKENVMQRNSLREALSSVYDIERLCSRIVYGTVNARDCVALRSTLSSLPAIIALCSSFSSRHLKEAAQTIDPMEDILDLLSRAIVDDPPANMKEGNIIRPGYHETVDKLKDASEHGRQWLLDLESKEREATGIKNLRIGFNKVFGYYIEVTKSYQNLVPYHYHRKQTLANAERYITPTLKQMEETILGAQDQLIALELQLFSAISETLLRAIRRLQSTAAILSELDVYQSFAQVAADYKYTKPTITQDGVIELIGSRHPVVERTNRDQFIPNNVRMDTAEDRLIILTGPNMAGKSTYMRQVALIVLMAHIGSFVPADEASVCLTDRIFTRVGASDDLASGQSTFMVEMSEMANILHSATANSLLVLDEIGRGTSTVDGLSIAWAVLEHISDQKNIGAKTLFATHYHELTELEGRLGGVKNYRIAVKEVGEDILFLRKIMRGSADKSFGIQVARLAGLPDAVIARAKEILKELGNADINKPKSSKQLLQDPQQQLSLLASEYKDEVWKELLHLDVDALTPIDSLNLLNLLHQKVKLADRT